MLFSTFANYLEDLETVRSRLEMTEKLAGMYTALDSSEVARATYLLQGNLVPNYQSLEFQLSIKMVIRALARVESQYTPDSALSLFGSENFGEASEQIEKLYKEYGDLGKVARYWIPSRTPTVSLLSVYESLCEIAKESGTGSQERKLLLLSSLLNTLDAVSAKFVVRIIVGKLRLGFSTMTLLDALSWAVVGNKTHRALLEDAYQKQADVGKLAEAYLREPTVSATDPEKVLSQYSVTVGIPVIPALCQRLNTSAEIIEKMGQVIAEPKYDGLRVQIHFKRSGFETPDRQVKAYTRNLEDVTHMFPELAELAAVTKCEQLVLDSEAIGYDSDSGALLPFQETITRKRKHDITTVAQKVPIRFFVFDVLLRDSVGLIEKTLRERKDELNNVFFENRTFKVAPLIETTDPETLHTYHESLLAQGLEGAVIKKVTGSYQSGRKGWSWVKIKESEGTSGKLRDTIDTIVMGYYRGRGKRTSFGMGAFLVGVRDEADDSIKTIAKIGTGISEAQLTALRTEFDAQAVPQQPPGYSVAEALVPDVWIQPGIVVEIAADEITKSPIHTASVALRFPRLLRVREDKGWQEATTLSELQAMV